MSADLMPAKLESNFERLMREAKAALPEYIQAMRDSPEYGRAFADSWGVKHGGDARKRNYLIAAHINHIRENT